MFRCLLLPCSIVACAPCCLRARRPSPSCSFAPGQVAFLCGLIYTAVGLLRLGTVVNFLSHR